MKVNPIGSMSLADFQETQNLLEWRKRKKKQKKKEEDKFEDFAAVLEIIEKKDLTK